MVKAITTARVSIVVEHDECVSIASKPVFKERGRA